MEEPGGFHRGVGGYRRGPDERWTTAAFELHVERFVVRLQPAGHPGPAPERDVPLAAVVELHELLPSDGHGMRLEVALDTGQRFELAMPEPLVAQLCTALEATAASAVPDPVVPPATRTPSGARPAVRLRRALAIGALAVALLGGAVLVIDDDSSGRASASPGSSTTSSSSSSTTSTRAEMPPTTGSTTTTVAPSTSAATTSTTAAPTTTTTTQPIEIAMAPLTGLPADARLLRRPALVSKIDGAIPAMPPMGMDRADLVFEVRIEWGYSRYLAVWHSQDAPVIGPHRSARTTDPFLLSMFGHPLFAYSGANPKVLDTLGKVPWATLVPPGAMPHGYYRDPGRPAPHDLFARTDTLRQAQAQAPAAWPGQLFSYRPLEAPSPGVPVHSFSSSAGPAALFTWDPALDGWRRRVHNLDHVHSTGAPVAPTNVVVLDTLYRESHADARSPEAVSMGAGRAWVFSGGRVTTGLWTRSDHTRGWDLRDAAGAALTLRPGSTWVVLADREPEILPTG